MRRAFFIFVSFLLLTATLLCSCARQNISCYEVALKTSAELSLDFPIYSPSVKEGERGYCDSDFLFELYGIDSGCVVDFAVILASTLDCFGEIAILACHTEYDAILCESGFRARLRYVITHAGTLDVSSARTAEIFREGRLLMLCAVKDNARVMRLMRSCAR